MHLLLFLQNKNEIYISGNYTPIFNIFETLKFCIEPIWNMSLNILLLSHRHFFFVFWKSIFTYMQTHEFLCEFELKNFRTSIS